MSLAQARYRLIANGLAEAIAAGRYLPGSRLPTEAELCRQFAASRFTVRQALASLRADGQISSRPGIGSVVTATRPRRTFVESIETIDDILRHDHAPFVVDATHDVVADGPLADELDVKPGQAFLRIEGMRFHDVDGRRVPFAWGEIYVAAAYAGIHARLSHLDRPIASVIADMFGVTPARIDQEIRAAVMPTALARRFDVKPRGPALRIVRRYRTADGSAYEIARSTYPADRFIYRNTLTSAP
jgi:DNA-binding GntR family transcriptional regulator